ncbi:MAG: restriction endonuclease subunit S [Clostridia bacterium]|nr:restriction endonuclease subunit S [Clostridia bacterium]
MTTIKLKDCANIKTGKLNSNAAVIGGIYPFFTCDPETSQIDYFSFDEEAILLAGNNASGKFTIKYYVGKFNAYQRTYIINSSTDTLKTKYLYYFLSTKLPQFTTLSSGSATKFLTKALLDNCDIEVPSLDEQSHIVDILGSIDDKIENLEEINSKLQNYCIAKYRLLFSDVEHIPLSNIAAITMGQSPAGNTLNDEDGVVFYQGRTDFGFRYPTVRLFTTDPKRMAKAGDILLSVRAPVGDVNIAAEDCCIGRGIAAVSSEYNSFVYYSILNQKSDFDIYNNSGTIFGSINRDALSAFKIPAANISLIETFESMASNVDKSIHNNTKEIDKLRTLKQTYLQKFFG